MHPEWMQHPCVMVEGCCMLGNTGGPVDRGDARENSRESFPFANYSQPSASQLQLCQADFQLPGEVIEAPYC
jgi:hypothetical protein